MTGRRTAGLSAAIAGAAVLAAVAAWFLRDSSGPSPPTEGGTAPARPLLPAPGPIAPASSPPGPARPGPAGKRPSPLPPPPRPGEEDERPRLPPVPPGTKIWARLRLAVAGTGGPLPEDADPSVDLLVPRAGGDLRIRQAAFLLPDGRLALAENPGESSFLAADERRAARYEVAAYGFRSRTDLARADLAGDREVALEPEAPAAAGVLQAGPGLDPGPVRCELLAADGRGGLPGTRGRPPHLPRALGPFALHDVAEGRWRLRIWVRQQDGTHSYASVEFERGSGTADLGTIVLAAPVTLRARVVGADGTGVLDRGLAVQAAGEEERAGGTEPDAQGWMEFRGLAADADYRVFSDALKVEQTVHTPAGGTRVLSVELRHELRGVRCRLRFTVKGQDPIQWGAMFEGPTLDEGAWKKDGFLDQEMAPGEYLFGFFAQAIGTDAVKRYMAKLTVPDQISWDATIDLKEDL